MMIISAVIFFILAWYIEAVNPGEYGVPEKPWFFFTVSLLNLKPVYALCVININQLNTIVKPCSGNSIMVQFGISHNVGQKNPQTKTCADIVWEKTVESQLRPDLFNNIFFYF